jgi:hypothetical protein
MDYALAPPGRMVLFGGVRNQYQPQILMFPTLSRKEVKYMKYIANTVIRLAAAGILAAGVSTSALADSVSLGTTGPDSTNTVTIDNSSSVDVTETNNVEVTNANIQVAQSGDVDTSDNTSVNGGSGSGNASNNNSTSTSINISGGGFGGSTGGNGGSTGGNGGTSGGLGGSTGGNGGAVLGASTGGFGAGSVATLPEVGASIPMDVSALRALTHPSSSTTPALAQSKSLSAAFLGLASMLSLIGAGVTAWINRRREAEIV